ncbi:unnamed protein product [Porites evermanni]|uniref:Small ribosomal subunit protein mS29 n=1 Tax=Porites evermanni TaxID=104178 RepID=A0ABN8M522_9CNID|nr:unnamed protein product [Porites evermanni]
MAAVVNVLRSRSAIFSVTHMIENGYMYWFPTKQKPMMKEFFRCVSNSRSADKTDDEQNLTDVHTNAGPEVDLGELDPALHTVSNVGQFYTVPKEISKKVLSPFLTKKFKSQCDMMGSTSLMIRKPALEVLHHLKAISQDTHPPPKFIFYGMDGCGKSSSLAHVIHYCYSAGWFILPVPSVFSWVHGKSELQMSTFHAGRFDQPQQASTWLQICRTINSKIFSELKTSQKYHFGKRDSTEAGDPLARVIDLGLQRGNYATDAVGVLLKEIKNNTSLRVLFAVNEFNGFFLKTSFMDAKQKYIKPERLSLVHHFTELLDPSEGLKRGAMVFALSRTGMERTYTKSCEIADLLEEGGLSAVGDFNDVQVPRYSQEELASCLQFYRKRGLLSQGSHAQTNQTKIEQTLIKALFKNYDSEGRPVLNLSEPVLVKFGIAYSNLHSLDEKNQVLTSNVWIRQQWHDPWLSWDPAKYNGLKSINISPNLVWKPDIILYNSVNEEGDHGEQYLFDTKVIVSSDGTATWFSPNLIQSSCKINVRYFPWDTQTCKLQFGSWTFDGLKLDIVFYGDAPRADLSSFTRNGEWNLLSAEGKRNVLYYSCCPEPYLDLTFEIKIQRRTLFYINNLVVPCIVLALLTATAFLFPPETGERISLMITILLGMTVFMIVVVEAIPSTSEGTPLISTYFSVVMVVISLGLLCTCLCLNLEHHHPKMELTGWCRYILFDLMGPVLSRSSVKRLKRKQQEYNREIKLSTCYLKENQVAPEEDKIAMTGVSQTEIKNVKMVEKEIKVAGMDKVTKFIDKSLSEDRRKLEWHIVVNIIDNFFFVVFVLTITVSSLIILMPNTDS